MSAEEQSKLSEAGQILYEDLDNSSKKSLCNDVMHCVKTYFKGRKKTVTDEEARQVVKDCMEDFPMD